MKYASRKKSRRKTRFKAETTMKPKREHLPESSWITSETFQEYLSSFPITENINRTPNNSLIHNHSLSGRLCKQLVNAFGWFCFQGQLMPDETVQDFGFLSAALLCENSLLVPRALEDSDWLVSNSFGKFKSDFLPRLEAGPKSTYSNLLLSRFHSMDFSWE